ncbi:MAG TPA: NAD(P)/FAD-dependent oxidoreductase [Pseudogracilibacillus sp.]|nr:NAD(P)/FAD-dependent oxidoreductase [Pseudogracilibacillus sp.]
MNEEIYDLTILGAGPAGLFTAFYGGMRQAKVKLIESLPHTGGQLTALYPEKEIYDVAGFPNIRAQDLVDNLEKQLQHFDQSIVLGQSVEHVEKIQHEDEEIFKLTSHTGEEHYSRVIIIAAGNGAFEPRRLNVNHSEQFENINLFYYVKDMNRFKDEHVAILGGGDSAVDWALMLEPIAKQVTLIHRRDDFRAHEHSISQLKQSSVNILTPYVATDVEGEDKIERLVLQETRGEDVMKIDVDSVICNYGFISRLGPIADWGLNIERNSIVVNQKMETNIEGIYAVGDINTYEGKVKLIATGFGDGPTAVNNAMQYINPKARIQPRHSTSMNF